MSKAKSSAAKSVRKKAHSEVIRLPQHHDSRVSVASELRTAGKDGVALRLLEGFICQRKHANPSESYTAYLASAGVEEAVRIMVDEAVQLALKATTNGKNSELLVESADLLFNILVLLDNRGISFSEIIDELVERVIESGYNVKAFRKLKEGSLTEADLAEYIIANSTASRGHKAIGHSGVKSKVSKKLKAPKKLKTKVATKTVKKSVAKKSKTSVAAKATKVSKVNKAKVVKAKVVKLKASTAKKVVRSKLKTKAKGARVVSRSHKIASSEGMNVNHAA